MAVAGAGITKLATIAYGLLPNAVFPRLEDQRSGRPAELAPNNLQGAKTSRLCEDRTGTEIAAAGPEHIGQRRGHEEAKQDPGGEEEKEHCIVSLYRQPIFGDDDS